MVLGRFKDAKLRISFRQSSPNPETKGEGVRQYSFQRRNAVTTKRLAVVRPMSRLQTVGDPFAQPLLKLK
ncbi:hypothetical protein P4234_13395 [Pseudomonas aeruginosa]|nr:hypothetical protein [Pseudomonas aeruginosa]